MNAWSGRQGGYWLAGGSIAIVGFCLGAAVDRQAFFACWLAAWWTCAGAVLGSQANLWLHTLTGGSWGWPLRPIWQRAGSAMPMLLALMLPLGAATWMFYPWSDPAWSPQSQVPTFQALWLSPVFVTLRLVVYAALWQALSLASGRRKWISAMGLIVYGITVSLASVDLVLSLSPQWHSSGFGLIAITMQMKLGFALGVVCAAPKAFHPQTGRDWGNLLLMYVLMWAYLAYVQFLIIWAENLPAEITWYVPRLQTDWFWLGLALVSIGFFVPLLLLLLLLRTVKHNHRRLRAVATLVCTLGGLESVWVILPSVPDLSWHALWMAPLALAGMAALLWYMAIPRDQPGRQADGTFDSTFQGGAGQ